MAGEAFSSNNVLSSHLSFMTIFICWERWHKTVPTVFNSVYGKQIQSKTQNCIAIFHLLPFNPCAQNFVCCPVLFKPDWVQAALAYSVFHMTGVAEAVSPESPIIIHSTRGGTTQAQNTSDCQLPTPVSSEDRKGQFADVDSADPEEVKKS